MVMEEKLCKNISQIAILNPLIWLRILSIKNKLVSAAVPLTDPLPDAPSQHVPRIVHRDVKVFVYF